LRNGGGTSRHELYLFHKVCARGHDKVSISHHCANTNVGRNFMDEKKTNKFGATIVDRATQSFFHFSSEIEQTEMLMFFLLIGDDYISENTEQARQTLVEIYKDPGNKEADKLVEFFRTENADRLFDMTFYERHFSQMAFSRSIDNFTTYFKDILAEVVIKTPQILKSKDQERLDFILSHENMDDLLKSISEKKIEELFYKGINDIEKFFEERLGIQIFKDGRTKKTINMLIQQRNLIVHNRGKVSKSHANEFPEMKYTVGHYLTFEYEKISKINMFLSNFLIDLDKEISTKFKLDLLTFQ
jgi:hypothetical protein